MSKSLTPRLLDILEGRTYHTPAERRSYLGLLKRQGYDLTCVQDLPGILTQAANYTVAKVRQVGHRKATPEEQAERLAICGATGDAKPCSLYRFLDGEHRCAGCGCYLSSKVIDETATCPQGHWQILGPDPAIAEPPADRTTELSPPIATNQ